MTITDRFHCTMHERIGGGVVGVRALECVSHLGLIGCSLALGGGVVW